MGFRAGDANNGETGFALIIKSSIPELCSRFIGQARCDCPAIPVGLSRTSPYAVRRIRRTVNDSFSPLFLPGPRRYQ
jgi:hypothetical protein